MTYSILVENTGNVDLSNIQVTDDLATTFAPATSFSIVSVISGTFTTNPNYDGDTDGGANPTHINLLAGTDSLAVGANGTITLVVLVDTGGNADIYTNTADAQGTPPSGPDVQDSDSIPGPSFIDPALTKAVDPSQAAVGDVVTFTITVFNNGNVAATGVVVTDTLPDNLDHVLTTSIDTATSLPRGTVTLIPPRTVQVDIGNLGVTDVIEITIVTRVNSLGQPPIQNLATLVADPPPQGVSPDPTQNNASAVVLQIGAPPGGGAVALVVYARCPQPDLRQAKLPRCRIKLPSKLMLTWVTCGWRFPTWASRPPLWGCPARMTPGMLIGYGSRPDGCKEARSRPGRAIAW